MPWQVLVNAAVVGEGLLGTGANQENLAKMARKSTGTKKLFFPGTDGKPGKAGQPGPPSPSPPPPVIEWSLGTNVSYSNYFFIRCFDCPAGPAGIVGDVGQKGAQGRPGQPGHMGRNGIRGLNGQQGERGPPGIKKQKIMSIH